MADITATLDRYSALLGWGLSGHQEECLTLLDIAIEELACRRTWHPMAIAPDYGKPFLGMAKDGSLHKVWPSWELDRSLYQQWTPMPAEQST